MHELQNYLFLRKEITTQKKPIYIGTNPYPLPLKEFSHIRGLPLFLYNSPTRTMPIYILNPTHTIIIIAFHYHSDLHLGHR